MAGKDPGNGVLRDVKQALRFLMVAIKRDGYFFESAKMLNVMTLALRF